MEIAGKYRYAPGFGVYQGGMGEMNSQDLLPVLGNMPPPASFDGNDLFKKSPNPRYMPGNPGYVGPFKYEQDRDYYILNDPRSGVASSPSFEIPQPRSGPGTPGYSIYNDPRLPGARRMRREIERVLDYPPMKFPPV